MPNSKHTAKALSPRRNTTRPALSLDFLTDAGNSVACVGSQKASEGSLISGCVTLNAEEPLLLSQLSASILMTETLFDAAIRRCNICSTKTTTIYKKDLLCAQQVLAEPGSHSYPLIFHIPGNMPATHLDERRQIEYVISVSAKTDSSDMVNFQKGVTVTRLCPSESASKQVRSASPSFVMNMLIPSYISHDQKHILELELRSKEPTKSSRRLWQTRRIRWEIYECTQDIHLPCQQHTGAFRDQHRSTLYEDRHIVYSNELDLHRDNENLKPPFEKIENYSLPFRIHRPTLADITTPNGYKIWHELKLSVLYAYLKVPLSNVPLPSDFDLYNLEWLEMVEKINLNQKNNCEETRVQSWDEEVAPPYTTIDVAPPLY